MKHHHALRLIGIIFIVMFGFAAVNAQDKGLFPPDAEPITRENASALQNVAAVGRGRIFDFGWWQDGNGDETIIAGSALGIWLYGLEGDVPDAPFIPASDTWTHAAFSPDGRWIAATNIENLLRIFTAAGELHQEIMLEPLIGAGGTAAAEVLTFSPDGDVLAVGSLNGFVTLIDVASGETILRHNVIVNGETMVKAVTELAFSPDGERLAAVGGDDVWILDSETLEVEYSLPAAADRSLPVGITFSPTGGRVAIAFVNQITIWDFSDDVTKAYPITEPNPTDSSRNLSVANYSVSYSADGKMIAAASSVFPDLNARVTVLDVQTGDEIARLEGYQGFLNFALFHPTNPNLLAINGYDGRIDVWDVANDERRTLMEGHFAAADRLALSPDETLLVMTGFDRAVHLISTEDSTEIAHLGSNWGDVTAVTFSPDGKTLAAASRWKTMGWSVDDLEAGSHSIMDRIYDTVLDMTFTPDSQQVIGAQLTFNERQLFLWEISLDAEDTLTPAETTTEYFATHAVFSPDGSQIAVAAPGEVTVLNRESLEIVSEFGFEGNLSALTFSADGTKLAYYAADFGVRDLTSGERIDGFGAFAPEISAQALAFDPSGDVLVMGDGLGNLQVFDWQSGELLFVQQAHTDDILSLIFSADGRYLITGSYDGLARVWAVMPSD